MCLVHWFNINTNQEFFRYYRFLPFNFEIGLINNMNHQILGIYYIDDHSNIYSYNEYLEKLRIENEKSKNKLSKKIVRKLINVLEKYE